MLINADFSRRAVMAHEHYQWVASPQAGVERVMLDRVGQEQVCLQRVPPGALLFAQPVDGAEVLVLDGEATAFGQSYGRGSWLRLPPGETANVAGGPQGATVYLKTGHLGHVRP